MKLFGIAGWSGSGKTTLLLRLVPALVRQGIEVATVKHSHHDLAFGDGARRSLAEAGAVETVTAGPDRWAIVHEHHGAAEPALAGLVGRLGPVDLVLVEGFKRSPHPKLEVWDPALGERALAQDDASVVAIACDGPPPVTGRPVFDRRAIDDIAGFIVRYCGLDGR
ncbi:MAG: molybdopterin-guanine dinucleotide biosynthesis protein B [Pseudomonadota bacterium]